MLVLDEYKLKEKSTDWNGSNIQGTFRQQNPICNIRTQISSETGIYLIEKCLKHKVYQVLITALYPRKELDYPS